MRKARVWILAGALLLIGAAGGWYVLSPVWTLRQMAAAARAHDADKLAGYIDYPKLRASTKAQLKARLTAKLESGYRWIGSESSALNGLEIVVVQTMTDKMVDHLVTPNGLAAMFAVDRSRADANNGGLAGAGTTAPAERGAEKPMGLNAANREIVREGLDGFRLHEKGKAGQDGDLIFERHGLNWKLAKIQVPEKLFSTT